MCMLFLEVYSFCIFVKLPIVFIRDISQLGINKVFLFCSIE